ncbi:MAG: (Fe-S)-binding protein [Theionarchaea archaeon]|nr:(Fe-S)-binding protein [Theionarchaea archaeon]
MITADEMDFEFSEEVEQAVELGFHACMQCGTCSARCPSGRVSQYRSRELFHMAQLGLKDRIFSSDDLWSCTTCLSCMKNCPWEVKTTDAILKMRALAAQSGHVKSEHEPLIKSMESYDNPWLQPRSGRQRWARKLDIKDLTKEQGDFLYYVGCTAGYDPRLWGMTTNVTEILKSAGVDIGYLGKKEACCGGTVRGIGHPDIFERLANANKENFDKSGAHTIVYSCPGCLNTQKNAYPRVVDIEQRRMHAVELVAELLKEGKIPLKEVEAVVTYHDPCHLGRHCGVFDAPREILKAIPGVELREMQFIRENSWCCGAGGGVKTGFTDRAVDMAVRRLEQAEETGADVIVSACSFCYQNLLDGIKKKDSHLEMMDIMELLKKAIKDD